MTLRPIGPRDAGVLQAYVRGLSPDSRYHRFFGALYELPPAELDRVIHLDRKYELALLAETVVDSAPIVIGMPPLPAQEIGLPVCCTTDFAAVQLRAMRMSHFVIGGSHLSQQGA